jgi:hypothetical protein
MRRRQIGEFHRLDVARTIAATIESRGYPTFRYRPDSRVPEYLVLIDFASFRDHQARLFSSLARAMEREGLFVTRYFYDNDPRICRMESADRGIHLTDLHKNYSSHRLLLFGDGEKLLDPISGQLAPWTALLHEWPERAVMTPVSRRLWGLREKMLAGHFIVLPATLEGLREFRIAGNLGFSTLGPIQYRTAAARHRTSRHNCTTSQLSRRRCIPMVMRQCRLSGIAVGPDVVSRLIAVYGTGPDS